MCHKLPGPENKVFSIDIIIYYIKYFFLKVCDGKEYAVHRVILAARSPVFKAMFARLDKVEGLPARAVVDDIQPHVLVSPCHTVESSVKK